ncbi:MAG: TetR/AcrR family transcriptional regulator [Deltaproteobacteria bacterium]|jgi:AcrR family transcriptional regulator|nr:TetR/AcrR family transcriptional regulator [Deltaproteobacteria bacterium]MBT4525672.1 TetR/AcrR family transcriptional regulator [Deltaproteobacteria bacterium]
MSLTQKEKSQLTRQRLKNKALALFGEKGFVKTTIIDITRQAGCAKGNFYRYWESKNMIFLEIMEERLSEYRSQREIALTKATNLEEVITVILEFLENIIDDKNWSKVFLEFTLFASQDEQLKAELNKSRYRLSFDVFGDLVRPFVDSDFPPEKIGALNTALFEGFLIQNILGTNIINKEDFRQAALALALHNGKK